MAKILALDLSSKSTGYAISIDDKLVEHGTITSALSNPYRRMIVMKNGIKELLEKYNIEEVVLEEVPLIGGNSHTQQILLNLQGVVLVTAHEYNQKISFKLLHSSTWRSCCGIHTGRGIKRTELKAKDIEFANKKYKLELTNDDEADRCCLLYAHLHEKKSFNWK